MNLLSDAELSANLHQVIKDHNHTIASVSREAGISDSTVRNLASAKTPFNPQLKQLQRLSVALGVDVYDKVLNPPVNHQPTQPSEVKEIQEQYIVLMNESDESYLKDWSEYGNLDTYKVTSAFRFDESNASAVETAKGLSERYPKYTLKHVTVTTEITNY